MGFYLVQMSGLSILGGIAELITQVISCVLSFAIKACLHRRHAFKLRLPNRIRGELGYFPIELRCFAENSLAVSEDQIKPAVVVSLLVMFVILTFSKPANSNEK
ncbi:uncharacterized protein LOC144630825 [Oculina patagonica]